MKGDGFEVITYRVSKAPRRAVSDVSRTDDALPYPADLSSLGDDADLYAGFDVGRKHDMSVLALIEKKDDAYISRGFVELRQAPFDEQEQTLGGTAVRSGYNPVR